MTRVFVFIRTEGPEPLASSSLAARGEQHAAVAVLPFAHLLEEESRQALGHLLRGGHVDGKRDPDLEASVVDLELLVKALHLERVGGWICGTTDRHLRDRFHLGRDGAHTRWGRIPLFWAGRCTGCSARWF
jgi:hypothetical protein